MFKILILVCLASATLAAIDPFDASDKALLNFFNGDACTLQPSLDTCADGSDKQIPRYYFDLLDGKCKKYSWSGCGFSLNSFDSDIKCRFKCLLTHKFFEEPINFFAGSCEMDKQVGPCKTFSKRYFFNTLTNACEEFVYSGCGGNTNNFQTYDSCANFCMQEDEKK